MTRVGLAVRRVWCDSQTLGLVLLFAWVASWFLPSIPSAILGADASTRGPIERVLAAVLTLPSFVMLGGGAWEGWHTRRAWAGVAPGFVVSLGFGVVLLAAYVTGIALGQPQLLRFALTLESVRAMGTLLATTTAAGTAMATLGGCAGALLRRIASPAGSHR